MSEFFYSLQLHSLNPAIDEAMRTKAKESERQRVSKLRCTFRGGYREVSQLTFQPLQTYTREDLILRGRHVLRSSAEVIARRLTFRTMNDPSKGGLLRKAMYRRRPAIALICGLFTLRSGGATNDCS